MRKIFSISMLIVGTMIGAGFCSGREVVSFFGNRISIAVAPVCGALIFLCCVIFLLVASRVNRNSIDKVNAVVLGKFGFIANIFLLLNSVIVLSAMIAGLNSLCKPFIHFPIVGSIAAVLCAVIACKGLKGILKCNLILVPLMITVISCTCLQSLGNGDLSLSAGVFELGGIFRCVMYVSMNMMLACTALTTMGKLTRKQIVWSSAIAAAVIAVLLALLICTLNCSGNTDDAMPILAISGSVGKWLCVLIGIITAISIFTTMLTCVGSLLRYADGKLGGKVFNSALVVISGTALGLFGFTRVVDLFYPLVGFFGIFYIVACIVFLTKKEYGREKRIKKYKKPKRLHNKKVFS